jgi:transposase, IS5 family
LEVCVLTLWAPQAESLWDESLPVEVRELPADLAQLDRVLGDPELMMVLVERWRQEVVETGRSVLTDGRPTIAMETYIRLMVLKSRYRWGTGPWSRRCRTRSICVGFAGSALGSGCPTSRRCAS